MDKIENFSGFEHLYDARIRTEDGGEFPVYRVLLAMHSNFFRKIFCNSFTQKDFLVQNIQTSTMETVLEYIYSSKVNFTENNITDILLAADLFGIEKLLKLCRSFAFDNFTTKNCVPLFHEGTKNKNLGILKAASRFIEVNFERVIRDRNSKFEVLTIESLHLLLSDSLLRQCDIWKAIELWINKFPDERKEDLKHLLPYMHFYNGHHSLAMDVLNHPLVKADSSHIQLVETILTQPVLTKQEIPKLLYFIIKYSVDQNVAEMLITYDENIDIWRHIETKSFCPDFVLHGCGSLIVMYNKLSYHFHTFDILSKTWSTLNPPNPLFMSYDFVKLGSHIYALGGTFNGITVMERYDFKTERWEFAAHHHALNIAVVTDENKIYIIGRQYLNPKSLVAEVYDSSTDMWHSINIPKVHRLYFALAVYKGQLFIMGGQNDMGYTPTVEVYYASSDTWRDFEDLPFCYVEPKAVVIKEVLYVYDNFINDDLGDLSNPPVIWNDDSFKWQVVEASSPFSVLNIYQFCTIEDSAAIAKIMQVNRDLGNRWENSPFFVHLNS